MGTARVGDRAWDGSGWVGVLGFGSGGTLLADNDRRDAGVRGSCVCVAFVWGWLWGWCGVGVQLYPSCRRIFNLHLKSRLNLLIDKKGITFSRKRIKVCVPCAFLVSAASRAAAPAATRSSRLPPLSAAYCVCILPPFHRRVVCVLYPALYVSNAA